MLGFEGVSTREMMLRQIARSGASLLHSFVLPLWLKKGEITFPGPCLWLLETVLVRPVPGKQWLDRS